MSELKHTPGPWAYDGIQTIRANGKVIVSGIKPFAEHGQENARLIAAAPDMYEAIQYAIAALADNGGMVETGELITNVDKARKRLQKAIKSLI